MEHLNEEFNNFMYRVTEISEIVKKMRSDNKDLQRIGQLEADKYLKDNDRTLLESIDENNVALKLKADRSVINRKAFEKIDRDPGQMSQEAFMDFVEKDAEERRRNKKMRQERAETYKTQAAKAFKRGEFEKALNCYNKAIEQIKDNYMLYLNRALTYINIKLYDYAIGDIKTAQKFKEDSLKSWLLLAKAHRLNGDVDKSKEALEEAKSRNPEQNDFIKEYEEGLTGEKEVKE